MRSLIILFSLFLTASASADTLLLVHGYLGSGKSFREKGIVASLINSGWQDGGNLGAAALQAGSTPKRNGSRVLYTVDLPSEAPVRVQASWLNRAMDMIDKARVGHSLHIAAHSAGGVVARYALVVQPRKNFASLITIASPHLGTQLAETGMLVGRSPLSMITPMLGASEINRGQALFSDLQRPRPGSLLYYLNASTHPKGRYISIIRTEGGALGGDNVVTAYSQDLRNIPVLRAQAEAVPSRGGHMLQPADGPLLVRLLNRGI